MQTLRLSIAPLTLADLESIARWESDTELRHLNDESAEPAKLEEVEATLRGWLDPARDDIAPFGLRLREDDRLIGWCMLARIDRAAGECRVGLTIGERDLWGRGLGGEALGALVDRARELGMRRVVAELHEFNDRSRRLFERAGFRLVARHAGEIRRGARAYDELVFALDVR